MRHPLTISIRSRVIPSLCALALVFAAAQSVHAAPPDAQTKRSPVLAALQAELERSMKTLSTLDPPAYYTSYTVTETQRADVSGSNGALLNSNEGRNRWLEVSVRTGSYNLDNSHKFGERQAQSGGPGAPVPIDDDAEVLRRTIWLETDKQYRAASEALIKIKTGKEVKVETAEGRAPDFSREEPHVSIGSQVSIAVDRKPWEERVRAYTKAFRDSQAIINSIVTFAAQAQNAYQVTSEGTQLQYGQIRYRPELFIQGKAPDGMDIVSYYNFDWVDAKEAPDDQAVHAAEATMRKEPESMVPAPI